VKKAVLFTLSEDLAISSGDKMKISIRIKLFIYMIISILLFAVFLFGANSFFAEKYYIKSKKTELAECGDQIVKLLAEKKYEEIALEIGNLEKEIGGTIVIADQTGEIYYPFEARPDIFNAPKDTLSYVVTQDDGLRILIWVPMTDISENAAISNRFTIIVGIFTIIVTGFFSLIFSARFTNPIKEMNTITKQMSRLDFSRILLTNSRDELGELSESINQLGENLSIAINNLNDKNEKLQQDIIYEREQDKMRRELLSNVSHELKTPVFLIQGYAEGLKTNIAEDESRKSFYCDVIMEEAEKMDILIRDILDLSRIEARIFPVEKTSFDLSLLVATVLSKYEQLFIENGIELITEIEENIQAFADTIRVEQIIANYINNAINHVDENKIIKIILKDKGNMSRLSVYNSGTPIPEEDIHKIWTSFYKVDKARTREADDNRGTGLGLSIVRAIQDAHGYPYGVINLSNGVLFWCEFGQ
jgi:two-component system sensor histidine kinase VanS